MTHSSRRSVIRAAAVHLQVLGFVLGRGPLEMPLDAVQFGVVQVLPVTPQDGDWSCLPRDCMLTVPDSAAGASLCAVAVREVEHMRGLRLSVPAAQHLLRVL